MNEGYAESKKKVEKVCKKGVKSRKRCEIANLEEFLMENLCKPYIIL